MSASIGIQQPVHGSKLAVTDTATGNADIVLLLIRMAAAIAFLFHGSQILFGALGGPGLQGFSAATHMPLMVATLVGVAQFGGGLAMLTGLFTRIGAAGIAVVMIGAIVLVHLPNGFSVTKNGIEYPLTQLMIALAVLVAGPGRFSLSSRMSGVMTRL
jgi:putative oxidoreductase